MRKSDIKKLERMRERLVDMCEALDEMASAYRDKYNDASEKWQMSEAGQECDTLGDQLEQAAADVEAAESIIQDLLS